MELTLNIPAELADRLPSQEEQLELILELGLQVLQAEEDSNEAAEGAVAQRWRATVRELLRQRRDAAGSPPEVAELLAYHRGELDSAASEALLERLILYPQAARDLLDLMAFAGPEAPGAVESSLPSPSATPSPALQAFRARLEAKAGKDSEQEFAADAPLRAFEAEGAKTLPMPIPVPSAAPSRSRAGRGWIGWTAAAVLAMALGLTQVPTKEPSLDYASIIEVSTSRGVRPFSISQQVGEVLIVLPGEPRVEGVRPPATKQRLRVFDPAGEVRYEQEFEALGDSWSQLYVRLPRKDLSAGTYRIEVSTEDSEPIREYWFSLHAPEAQ